MFEQLKKMRVEMCKWLTESTIHSMFSEEIIIIIIIIPTYIIKEITSANISHSALLALLALLTLLTLLLVKVKRTVGGHW